MTLAARSAEELDRVAGRCRDRGGKAIAVIADVSNQSQCKVLIERSIDEYGRIVVIISRGAKFVMPGSSGYCANKHAMVGFFDSLRVEFTKSVISVTAIYPDWVATGITARALGLLFAPILPPADRCSAAR
jgi:short-subunit dehydrogenase